MERARKEGWNEEAATLSQEEVEALPDRTVVWILWSGGNGPHQYMIHRHQDILKIRSIDEEEEFFLRWSWRFSDPLSFVGLEPPYTVIWKCE